MRRAAAVLFGLVALACDAPPGDLGPPAEETRPTSTPETETEGPPPLPGTIEACAAALAQRTPREVSATLDDLAYDTIFRDACTAQRAEADRTSSLCDDLSVTVLRDRCHERVAIARAEPMACPGSRAGEGRDPLCVALARRDPRLCAAAGTLERAVCEAVLIDGDDHPGRACARLPIDLRLSCIARSLRLAALATGDRVDGEPVEPSITVRIGEEPEQRLTSADRGARIVYEACIPMLVIGEERTPGLVLRGPGSMLLRVPLGTEAPVEADIGPLAASLELSTAALRGAHVESGHVSVGQLERELGGLVSGTFTAEVRGLAAEVHVEGAFVTFVRDLEGRPDACPSP